jgi:hypothetical protein
VPLGPQAQGGVGALLQVAWRNGQVDDGHGPRCTSPSKRNTGVPAGRNGRSRSHAPNEPGATSTEM